MKTDGTLTWQQTSLSRVHLKVTGNFTVQNDKICMHGYVKVQLQPRACFNLHWIQHLLLSRGLFWFVAFDVVAASTVCRIGRTP